MAALPRAKTCNQIDCPCIYSYAHDRPARPGNPIVARGAPSCRREIDLSGMRTTVVPVLAFVLCTFCNAAVAERPAVSVAYADLDLDLTTRAGATEMYSRVYAAAATVCAPEKDPRSGRATLGYELCVNTAVAATVYRAAMPRLTSLYQSRTGRIPRG